MLNSQKPLSSILDQGISDVPKSSLFSQEVDKKRSGFKLLKDALETRELIPSQDNHRREILLANAVAFAEIGDVKSAFKIVKSIEDQFDQLDFLISLAVISDNKYFLDIAQKRLKKSPGDFFTVCQYTTIGRLQAKIGDSASSEASFSKAIELAEKFTPGFQFSDMSFETIAKDLAKIGDIESAKNIANRINQDFYREIALKSISEAQALNGDYDSALQTFDDRDMVLSIKAIKQAKNGEIESAFQTLNSIKDDPKKTEVLSAIVKTQLKIGKYDAALETVKCISYNENFDLIGVFIENSVKIDTIISVIKVQAIADAEKAKEAIELMDLNGNKAKGLIAMAKVQMEQGYIADGRHTFQAAQDMIDTISNKVEKMPVLCFLAQTKAELGIYEESRKIFQTAIKVANSFRHNETTKIASLFAIANAQIEAGKNLCMKGKSEISIIDGSSDFRSRIRTRIRNMIRSGIGVIK